MESQKRKRVMPRWLSVTLLLLILCIGGLYVTPQERFKQAFLYGINHYTETQMTIDGAFALRFLPSFQIEAENVTFFRAPDQGAKMTGQIINFDLEMSLLSLILGRLEVEQLALSGLTLEIQGDPVGAAGRWIGRMATTVRKEERGTTEAFLHFIESAALKDVRFDNSHVMVKNQDNAALLTLSHWDGTIKKPREGTAFEVQSTALVNERTVDFKAYLADPSDFIRGFRSPITMTLESRDLQMTLDGTGAHRDSLVMQGALGIGIPSHQAFCAWLLTQAPPCGDAEGGSRLDAGLTFKNQVLLFSDMAYQINQHAVTGQGQIDMRQARPAVDFSFGVKTLEYDPVFVSHAASLLSMVSLDRLYDVDMGLTVDVAALTIANTRVSAPQLTVISEEGALQVALSDKEFLDGTVDAMVRLRRGPLETTLDGQIDWDNLSIQGRSSVWASGCNSRRPARPRT